MTVTRAEAMKALGQLLVEEMGEGEAAGAHYTVCAYIEQLESAEWHCAECRIQGEEAERKRLRAIVRAVRQDIINFAEQPGQPIIRTPLDACDEILRRLEEGQ